jgi:hypothetical protein
MLAGEALDQFPNLLDLVRIETDGRLVEDDDIGIVDDRLRNADPLFVAAGKALDQFAAARGQAGQRHCLVDPRGDVSGADAFDAGDEREVVLDRHLRVERWGLG